MKTEPSEFITKQVDWIKSGKIGCVFASALVKDHDSIVWNFIVSPDKLEVPKGCFIYSAIFPDGNVEKVKQWALSNGMYFESISDLYNGLRVKQGNCVAWVQYFGPDSHVKTRQSPYPMLSFCVKLPSKYYAKVGFNGILHLAHASVDGLSKRVSDLLWDRSIVNTEIQLGHKPTMREAAKTTFEKKQF